ncbi:MAG TPA: plastocyanin/azurin family copper-binding protein [Gaiellaceae bacterium]|jgi:plastocyanin|nr:plastocyanin/azurin family copper-binding protein [Gaiellaceae bacterium]
MTLVLVALALAVGATACGGGSSSGETTEAATTSEGGAASASGTLDGEVGPGYTIEVSQNGEDAETVKAGTYTLKVEDKSDAHNFHLIGPGVDNTVTEVPFKGEKTVTVTLKKGTYTYQCDPHAARGMKGSFTVT